MKKIGPPTTELKNLEDFEKLVPKSFAVILISEEKNLELKNQFDNVANEFNDVSFFYSSSQDIKNKLKVEHDAIVLI